MAKILEYSANIDWLGNLGKGTETYTSYSRLYKISGENKEEILASSAPEFRGDKTKYNPEELLIAALSSCHMLFYLHLCAVNKINVISYKDNASGKMEMNKKGGGKFIEATLKPEIVIKNKDKQELALKLHEEANELCFIANSCNFPIKHEPIILVE